MSNTLDSKVHEKIVGGVRVTVERTGADEFSSTVSYPIHNTDGVHIASPAWGNVGTARETKAFIVREVTRAPKQEETKQ